MSKGFWRSKTVWFNALAFLVAVLGSFGYTGELDPGLAQFVLPVVFVINLILRFFTNQAIRLR